MDYYHKKQKIINLINELFTIELERKELIEDLNKEYNIEIVCESCNEEIKYGYCEKCFNEKIDKLEMDNYDLEEKIDELNDENDDLQNRILELEGDDE